MKREDAKELLPIIQAYAEATYEEIANMAYGIWLCRCYDKGEQEMKMKMTEVAGFMKCLELNEAGFMKCFELNESKLKEKRR